MCPSPTLRVRPCGPPSHGSGSGWFATPFLHDSLIHYFTPVYPDANQPCRLLPPSLARSGHPAALGMAPAAHPVRQSEDPRVLLAPLAILFVCAQHSCLGLVGGRAYAAPGGKLTVIWPAVDAIKQQIP